MMVENSGTTQRSARSSETKKERGNSSKGAHLVDDLEQKLQHHGQFSARPVPRPPPEYRIAGSDKDAMLEDYVASSKSTKEPRRKIIHPPSVRVSRTDPELDQQPRKEHTAPHREPIHATQGKSARRHTEPASSERRYTTDQEGFATKSEHRGKKGRIRARSELGGPAAGATQIPGTALGAKSATHGKSVRKHSGQKGYGPVKSAEQKRAVTRGPGEASRRAKGNNSRRGTITHKRQAAPVQRPIERRTMKKSVKSREPANNRPQIEAVQTASLKGPSPFASTPLGAPPVSSQSRRKESGAKKRSHLARSTGVSAGDRQPDSVQQHSKPRILGPTDDVDETSLVDADDRGRENESATKSGPRVQNQRWDRIDVLLQEATPEQSAGMGTSSSRPESEGKISRQRSLNDGDTLQKRTTSKEQKDIKDGQEGFHIRSHDTNEGDSQMDNMEDIQLAQEALNSVMDMLIPSTPSGADAFSMPSVATTNIDTDELMSESTSTQLTQDRIALAEAALQNFMDVLQQDLERSVQATTRGDIPLALNGEEKRPNVTRRVHLLDLFRWSLSPNVDAEEKIRFLEQERERMTQRKDLELQGLIKTDEAMKRERLRQSREAEAQRYRVHQLEEDIGFSSAASSLDLPGGTAEENESQLNQLIMLSKTKESAEVFKDDEEGSPDRTQEKSRELPNEDKEMVQGAPSWAALGGRPVVTRDESFIDPNSLSRRQERKSEPARPDWTEIGGKPVVTTDKVTTDGQVSEEHQPTLQNRRNASDLSNHLSASHVDKEYTRRRPPPSLSSSSYSRVSTDPSWGSRRHSGSSQEQSEASAILMANTASAAAVLTLGGHSSKSESSSSEGETPVSNVSHTSGSMPSWAAFGGRPIVMSTSESSQLTENDRDGPEPNLLPSSFNEEDEIYGGSDEGSFEASFPLFQSHPQQDFRISLPTAPVTIESASADTSDTHDASTIPKLKPYSFFRATQERKARAFDEKPLLNQTDVISVGSAGDIHRHVGTIQYLEDRSMISHQSSALSLDPELKGDEERVPPVNPRWTNAGRRRSLGSSVKSSLKGIRNVVSARGCRDRFGLRRGKTANSSRDCLLHEGEGIFDRTPVLS